MNIGLQHGLISTKHYESMGVAIWLYLWCVWRQTKTSGLVLGGSPVTYEQIQRDLGCPDRTLRRWLDVLQSGGYIHISYLNYKKLRIQVLKPKKHGRGQPELPFPSATNGRFNSAKNGRWVGTKVADGSAKSGRFKQSKNKEQEKDLNTTALEAPVEWIPVDAWLRYVGMRKEIRRPLTAHAVDLAIQELAKLKAEGHEPRQVLEQSILNSWQGLFPIKERSNGKPESFAERNIRRAQEELGEVSRRAQQVLSETQRDLPEPTGRSSDNRNLPRGTGRHDTRPN